MKDKGSNMQIDILDAMKANIEALGIQVMYLKPPYENIRKIDFGMGSIIYGDFDYQIVVDRIGNNDTIEVQVELTPEMVEANDKTVAAREAEIVAGLKSMLGIKVNVKVVEPKTIERSEGKAKRVIDKRELYK